MLLKSDLSAMFALRLMLAQFRHWVYRTFMRDKFLTSMFADLQPALVHHMNAVSTSVNPADCIEIVGMMRTVSLDTRLARGREEDALVIFCISRMPIAEIKPIFSSLHRLWWFICGVEKNILFNAITNPAFYEHAKAFVQSKWAQRFSPEIVELMVKAYARCERASSPLFMAFWTQKGMTGSNFFLRPGMNAPRHHGLCLADAVNNFDRISEKVVQRIRKARDVD